MGYIWDLQQVVEPGTSEHSNLTKFLSDYGRKLPLSERALVRERYNEPWTCSEEWACCSGGDDFTLNVSYPSCVDGPFENTVWDSIDSILNGLDDE